MSRIIFMTLLALLTFGCTKSKSAYQKIQPAKVEKSSDSSTPPVVTLTVEAKARLGIEVVKYATAPGGNVTLPLSSLLYDNQGKTWVFIESKENEFQRHDVQVVETHKNQISIRPSFSNSALIVSHGAAELFGTESGVGK